MSSEDFSAEALLGVVIDDRFQILEKLGEGGMGAIYKARQLSVDRVVALKILLRDQRGDPISVERFRHEAYLASRLKHPNAIVIHDFGQTPDGLLYIAMEFLGGETLKQRLRRVGTMKVEAAVKIMNQTLRTIAEAHRMGMVHRDLKPDNVFLTDIDGDRDFVKVLDFGIAKLTAVQDGVEGYQGGLTMAGKIYGTPNYMSPEQIRGKPVEPQSDLYSLGVIFYELVTGRLPFVAQTPVEVMMMHLRDNPAPLHEARPDISLELERTVLRALEKDRRARYQSADEFIEALENYKFNSGFYGAPAQLAARAVRPTPAIGFAQPSPGPVALAGPEVEERLFDPAEDESPDQSFDGSADLTGVGAAAPRVHEERTLLEMGDEHMGPTGGEAKTFFEEDDAGSSQEIDDDDMMSSIGGRASRSVLPGGAQRAATLPRSEEPTMLELDENEVMDVEPSRIVQLASISQSDKVSDLKATRTGLGPPASLPPPVVPHSGAEKRTLMGHAAPPLAPPAARPPAPTAPPPFANVAEARVAPPPQSGAASPRVIAEPPVLKAPPRELNPRPTVVGLPMSGPVQGRSSVGKVLAIVVAILLAAAGAVAVVILAKPGSDGPAVVAPSGPPKLIIQSDPTAAEIFDRNLFVGETPFDRIDALRGEPHSLQIVKGSRTFRARVSERAGDSWVFVKLPDTQSGELGGALVQSDPPGATVRADGKEVGRTPLTYLGSAATTVQMTFELPGFAPQQQSVLLDAAVLEVAVKLSKP